ncbi:MAG: Hsp20/alpha crystallin family protein [archaeon]
MVFWKKKTNRESIDPFEGFFGSMDNFEKIEKMMDDMMKGMLTKGRQSNIERKPLVMGISIKMGADGIPRIEEFGNVKGQREGDPRISKSREPLADLREEPNAVTITAELPGISEKDLELKLGGKKLSIKAESKENSFAKELELPCEVNSKQMTKSFKNGILEIYLPKKIASVKKRKSS